jgi:hypothetical protein
MISFGYATDLISLEYALGHKQLPSSDKKCTAAFSKINEEWRKAAKSRIIYSKADYGELTSDLKSAFKAYDLEAMINKIDKLREVSEKKGKKIKIGLYIGRTPHENLPSDVKDEAKEDVVWASGDMSILPTEKGKEIEDITNRIYFWLDFANPECLKLIYGLFDIVVVDASTEKAFGLRLIKNFAPLLHDSKSQLITRVPPIAQQIVTERTKKRFQITVDEIDKFGISKLNEFEHYKTENEVTEEFEECFHDVKKINGCYPYNNPHYKTENQTTTYYVASNVKR